MKTVTRNLVLVGLLAGGSIAALAVADGPGKTDGAGGNQPAAAADDGREGRRWGRRGGPRHSFGDMLGRHAQELGLTAQQLQAIGAAEQAARPELDRLFQAVRDQRQASKAGQENTDQLQAAHQALQTRREALRTQIDGILTAEQKTKLQQLRQQMRDKDGRRGPRHDKGAVSPAPAGSPT